MNEFWKLRQKVYRKLDEIGSTACETLQTKAEETRAEVLQSVKETLEETGQKQSPKETEVGRRKDSGQVPPKKDQSLFWCAVVFGLCMLFLFGLSHAPEGDHIGEAETPGGADSFIGQNYKNVQTKFEEAGFQNIQTEAMDDLVLGILTEEFEVEDVSVNGDTAFSSGEWVDRNAKVLIRYHVYPEEESSSETADAESDEPQKKPLTAENCPELAGILSNPSDLDPSYGAFAKAHAMEIIEFDGRIDDLTLHESYKTRYDVLLSAGDFDPNTMVGPYFKFRDVNAQDMGMREEDVLRTGKNVHVVARVLEYNEASGLFFLDPIEVTLR